MQLGNQSSGRAPLRILIADIDGMPASAESNECSIIGSNVSSHRRLPSPGVAEQYPPAATQLSASSNPLDWSRSVETTMSWVIALAFEGLAIYGQAVLLYFPQPYEHEAESQKPAAAPQFNRDRHNATKAFAESEKKAIETAPARPQRAASAITSQCGLPLLRRCVKLWLAMFLEPKMRRAITQLVARDDRT